MSVNAEQGPRILKDLTHNDSWLKPVYVSLGQANSAARRLGLDDPFVLDQNEHLPDRILETLPQEGVIPRRIDRGKVADLTSFLSQHSGGIIIMRHGIQYVEEEDRQSLTGAPRKINLMRSPYNDKDQADGQSIVEAASLVGVFAKLQKDLGIDMKIYTSPNVRAATMAGILSFSNRFDVNVDQRLRCVDYPTDIPDDELDRLLGEQNNGALTWDQNIIDNVCGSGTFFKLNTDMATLISDSAALSRITLLVTHTPQMNAADAYIGAEPTRVPELGFRAISQTDTLQFPNNVFR